MYFSLEFFVHFTLSNTCYILPISHIPPMITIIFFSEGQNLGAYYSVLTYLAQLNLNSSR